MRKRLLVPAVLLAARAALGTGAQEANFFTPEMQALKDAYMEETQALRNRRTQALDNLLNAELENMQRLLEERRRAGNITGMAVARAGIRLFEQCREQLADEGDFVFPEQVRRELRPVVQDVRERRQALDQEHRRALQPVDATYAARLAELCRRQGIERPGGEEANALLQALLTAEPPSEAEAADAPAAETREEDAEPRDLGRSREAVRWFPLARVFFEVTGIEVMTFPLLGRDEAEVLTNVHVFATGRSYDLRYEPIRVLEPLPEALPAFRAESLRGERPVDVLQWPSPDNDWEMTVRARPGPQAPSRHGIEIWVGGPGSEKLEVVGGVDPERAAPDSDAPVVRVAIRTQPEGALVYVDRRLIRPELEPARTPCIVHMQQGPRDIVLRLRGYEDAVINAFEAREGRTLNWTFRKDPYFLERTVQVSARTPWRPAGVTVQAGDRLSITASGTWSCGPGRERVDAEGYPNNEQFYRYYFDPVAHPRQTNRANYGALIMRIGDRGEMLPVGTRLTLTAETSGELYLDINESDDGRARRDNTGALTVQIQRSRR